MRRANQTPTGSFADLNLDPQECHSYFSRILMRKCCSGESTQENAESHRLVQVDYGRVEVE